MFNAYAQVGLHVGQSMLIRRNTHSFVSIIAGCPICILICNTPIKVQLQISETIDTRSSLFAHSALRCAMRCWVRGRPGNPEDLGYQAIRKSGSAMRNALLGSRPLRTPRDTNTQTRSRPLHWLMKGEAVGDTRKMKGLLIHNQL